MIKESNVTVNVKDLDKAVTFYSSLGLTLKNRWGSFYAQMTAPGIVIGLHPTKEENLKNNSGNVSIGFTATNFDEAKKFLSEKSIKFTEREEEGGSFLHFTDPDGTALYFYKSKWG